MKTRILQAFMESPWAILPNKLAALEEIVARHVIGEKLSAEEIQARIHGASRPPEQTVQSVAILPLFGTIFPRANLMTEMSGATSAERFGAMFSQLVDDPNISAIALDVNSPGGQANGIPEVFNRIIEARGKKPIVAVVNHLAASGAYWIASAADEVVVTPSGEVGSIGVFSVHQDMSKALENEGVKITMIRAGKFKVEGNPYEPLSDEAAAFFQSRVDETYESFVNAVARGRGVSPDDVKSKFGEGRVVHAQAAVERGMADRIGTMEETVSRLLQNIPSAPKSSDSARADIQREAQSLRDRVTHILQKE